MNLSTMALLEPGNTYLVAHRGRSDSRQQGATRKVRRIFKGVEKRFGEISCAVFTSKVNKTASASFNTETSVLSIRGARVPRSEVSIPHYDLITAEPA